MPRRMLAPCPDSPNCVSSLASPQDSRHVIHPYIYSKAISEAKAALKAVIAALPRTKLIQDEEQYLHYEFTSLLLGFIDDVEFLFDEDAKTIHFRSASRVGYGDFGVNRRRMEGIRSRLQGKL